MSQKLEQALKNLRDILQEESSDHCVSVSVFFNPQGYQITHHTRSPGSLKRDGISMRNIKGEFIKDEFDKGSGKEFTVANIGAGWCVSDEFHSWHKPQPKRTFEINGVELPCPVEDGDFILTLYGPGRHRFKFKNNDDYWEVSNALVKILTEARDK